MIDPVAAIATAYRATYDSETPAGPDDHEFAVSLIAGLADKGFQVTLIPDDDQPVAAAADPRERWMQALSLPTEASYQRVAATLEEIGRLNTRRRILAGRES